MAIMPAEVQKMFKEVDNIVFATALEDGLSQCPHQYRCGHLNDMVFAARSQRSATIAKTDS